MESAFMRLLGNWHGRGLMYYITNGWWEVVL